jgi:type I restriction enzyme S subunit
MSEQQRLNEISAGTSRKLDLGPRSLDLPERWEKSEFGAIFNHQRGVNYSSDKYVNEGEGMIFLTLNAIAPGGGLKKDSLKFYEDSITDDRKVSSGDVLIANTDLSQDGEIIGYPVRVPTFDSDASKCFSHHLLKIEQKEEVYKKYFLEYLLSSKYVHDRMIAFSCGSTVLNLNTDLLDSLELPIPPLPEQRKIATVLHTVDRAIEKTKEIIERLNQLLVATRREIMDNGIGEHILVESNSRFGKIPDGWNISELNSVTDVVGGSTPSTEEPAYWNGEIPWATPSDLTGLNEPEISKTEDQITKEGLNSTSTHLLPANSILMTSRATIGECAVNKVEMATNQGFQNLIPGESLNTWYLYHRMKEEAAYLESIGSGSTFSEVSNSVVKKVKIPIPPLEEQKQIAEKLQSIESLQLNEVSNLTQLKQVKRGLMQDLLSGTVRTTDTNIEVPDEIEQYG